MASTYLTRTQGTPSNTDIGTISLWLKRGTLSKNNEYFIQNYTDGNIYGYIRFKSDDTIQVFSNSLLDEKRTTRVFRDTSAWYHIVLRVDTTQSTAGDRVRLYINGVQETSFTTNTNGSQNADYDLFKAGGTMRIGYVTSGTATYFDGSMSHFHYCDGQSYDATAFGEYDANGVWKIKTSPSVTYGNEGFFILKDGNSVTDQSGNTNNFTVGGGTLTNTLDCPSNVFATWNTLVPLGSFSNGNTVWDSVASGDGSAFSTIGAETGKYYMECKITTSNVNGWELGVAPTTRLDGATSGIGTSVIGGVGYTGDGNIRRAGSTVASGQTTFSQNDIIGCALDMDNRKVYFYQNGTALYSGVGVDLPSTTGAYLFGTGDWWGGVATQSTANFGNGYFGTTAVSSAGTNASGIGIFEYDVPTGYTALSTKGLNL